MALGHWRSRLLVNREVLGLGGKRLLTSMAASLDNLAEKGDVEPVPAIPFTG